MMTRRNNVGKFNMIFSTIDELLPKNHNVRTYDEAIDWTFIYPLVEDLYSDWGKPSIDPIILFKLVFLNYIDGNHSIRKTCERCKTDIAYRWFLRLNFEDKVPDHSTFSQNLKRKFLGTEVFDKIFTIILEEAYNNGFIDATNVFGDSTHVKANANKKKYQNEVVEVTKKIYEDDLRADINKDRIEHDKKPFEFENGEVAEQPNENNTQEVADDKLIKSADEDEIIDIVEDENGNESSKTVFDAESHEVIDIDKNIKYKNIKVSTVDPDCGFYHKGEHEKQFAYSVSALCDKNGFVLTTYITSGNIHDSVSFFGLHENYKKTICYDKTKLFCLDNGYTSPSIAKLVIDSGRQILTPYHAPMTKAGFFKKYEYVYDEKYDIYICPNNETLWYTTTNKDGYREYKSDPSKCKNCPFKSRCTNSKNNTKVVTQHIWNNYLEEATDTRYTIGNKELYAKRKETIERVFADGKENFGLRFTRYRSKERVTQNMLLLFACMNFKKMAKWKKASA